MNKKIKRAKSIIIEAKIQTMIGLAVITFGLYIYYGTDRSLVDTIYYSSMIITTVGFGDITPETDIEKIMIVMFMYIGIASLGALLGQAGVMASRIANLKRRGLHKVKKSTDILIIGYPSEQKVKGIVEHLDNDKREDERIVCINNVLEEKPEWMNKYDIEFVRGLGSNRETLIRANAMEAERCLILANDASDESSDDYSSSALTVFLRVNEVKAKILVEVVREDQVLFEYFDSKRVTTFKVDNAEVISQEILDRGAIQLKNATFSTNNEGTQFNIDINIEDDITWGEIAMKFMKKNSIAEGFAKEEETKFNLLPGYKDVLKKNQIYVIKYRSKSRIKQLELNLKSGYGDKLEYQEK